MPFAFPYACCYLGKIGQQTSLVCVKGPGTGEVAACMVRLGKGLIMSAELISIRGILRCQGRANVAAKHPARPSYRDIFLVLPHSW